MSKLLIASLAALVLAGTTLAQTARTVSGTWEICSSMVRCGPGTTVLRVQVKEGDEGTISGEWTFIQPLPAVNPSQPQQVLGVPTQRQPIGWTLSDIKDFSNGPLQGHVDGKKIVLVFKRPRGFEDAIFRGSLDKKRNTAMGSFQIVFHGFYRAEKVVEKAAIK